MWALKVSHPLCTWHRTHIFRYFGILRWRKRQKFNADEEKNWMFALGWKFAHGESGNAFFLHDFHWFLPVWKMFALYQQRKKKKKLTHAQREIFFFLPVRKSQQVHICKSKAKVNPSLFWYLYPFYCPHGPRHQRAILLFLNWNKPLPGRIKRGLLIWGLYGK